MRIIMIMIVIRTLMMVMPRRLMSVVMIMIMMKVATILEGYVVMINMEMMIFLIIMVSL